MYSEIQAPVPEIVKVKGKSVSRKDSFASQ
jgi:hypothetical protein